MINTRFKLTLLQKALICAIPAVFTSPVFAQGPDCSNPTLVTGVDIQWPLVFNGDSGLSTSNCMIGGGTQDSFYLWTVPSDGSYQFECYSPYNYSSWEVYLGADCGQTSAFCGNMGHDPFLDKTVISDLRAGDELIVRSIGMGSGYFEVTEYSDACVALGTDAVSGNNFPCSAAQVGNGLYAGIVNEGAVSDYYQVCLAAGETAVFDFASSDPNANLQVRFFLAQGCVYTDFLQNVHSNSPTFTYTNSTGADVKVLFDVNVGGTFEYCTSYDMLLSGVNGCDGLSQASDFCDPMDVNSTGLPTQLTAVPGSGVASGVRLEAHQGPPGQFGSVLIGTGTNTPGLMLGQGRFCLATSVGQQFARYNVHGTPMDSVGLFDAAGTFQNLVGTSQSQAGFDIPILIPNMAQFIREGETWHFQLWHRENGGASNFSNGVSVTFAGIP